MPLSGDAKRKEGGRLLVRPDAMTTPLVTLFVDEFGEEKAEGGAIACLQWHPETVLMEVEETFGVKLPEASYARLMAGIDLLTSDRFYKRLPDFITLANAIHGLPPGGGFDPPEVEEIAWAITEALLLSPPEDGDDEPFAVQVRMFIGQALDREGILEPPDVLAIGLRAERGRLRRVMAEYRDDPGIVAAIKEVEALKTREINDIVRAGLRKLIEQMGSLHLTHGNVDALLERLTGKKPA